MVLPPPRARLADCIWLPRIIAKARLLAEGRLPPEFAARFCVVEGCDEQFLRYFALTREEIVAAAKQDDAGVIAWFARMPRGTPERIREWNSIAQNMGLPGFPLEKRFPVGLATTYAHLAPRVPRTVFEMLEMDEGLL